MKATSQASKTRKKKTMLDDILNDDAKIAYDKWMRK